MHANLNMNFIIHQYKKVQTSFLKRLFQSQENNDKTKNKK